jgi:hypothetical protein
MTHTPRTIIDALEAFWTPSASEYHNPANGLWGSSMIRTFSETPWLAYTTYVSMETPPEAPSKEMTLGQLAHLLILEPDLVADEVLVVEVGSRAAKAYKTAAEHTPEKLVVIRPWMDDAERMAASVLEPRTEAARVAHALLVEGAGRREYSIRWEVAGGVQAKARLDYLAPLPGAIGNVDIKTTSAPDEESFALAVNSRNYCVQAALYERGLAHALGRLPGDLQGATCRPLEIPRRLLYVAIRNAPPYEVYVYEPDEAFLDLGRRRLDAILPHLAECLNSPDLSLWATDAERAGVRRLSPKPWMLER